MNAERGPRAGSHHSLVVPSLMALGAGVVWSLGALVARLADHADAWQYLLWRSFAILVVIEILARIQQGALGSVVRFGIRRAYTSGPTMVAGSACLAAASIGFIFALKNTTVANAAFLASLAPLLAAVLARAVLGERINAVTVVAVGTALCGLAFMVNGDLGVGNMKGSLAAVATAFGFAGYAVCARSNPAVDCSPALPGASSMTIPLVAIVCIARNTTFFPPAADIGLATLHGGGIIVIGMLTFNAATRHLSAAASIVFAQTESVFVPLWIYLWFAERPRNTTLIGGAVILGAVVGQSARRRPGGRYQPVGRKPQLTPAG